MITPSVGSNYRTAGETTAAAVPTKELGRDEFMTLLVAQLKNQDPLNPMEGQEFSAQLAQFSSLEQLFNLNDGLANIKNVLLSQENDRSLDYVGKTVKSYSNNLFKKDGSVDPCLYHIEGDANVAITVYDQSGAEVFSTQDGWQQAGEHSFQWDGRNAKGVTLPDGTYTYQVVATDGNGFAITSQTYVAGEVTGVSYRTGDPYLVIKDRMINPAKVIEVTKTME